MNQQMKSSGSDVVLGDRGCCALVEPDGVYSLSQWSFLLRRQ